MDLRGLEAFCTLARTLNFRSAAAELGVSQPAFSIRIARLEDELGMRLFDRSRAGVSLLETGRQFLPHASDLLERSIVVRETARSIASGRSARLRVGYTPVSFMGGEVPKLLRDYASLQPEVRIELTEGLSGEIEEAVATGRLDAGFVHPLTSTPGLHVHPISVENYVSVLPGDHPYADRETIRVGDLADEEFILVERNTGPAIYDRIIAMCTQAGFSPRIRQEVVNSIAVIGLVGAGYGVGFVIGSMRKLGRGDVAFIPIEGKSPELPLALAHDPARTSSALDRFIEFVEARSPQGV
ncbi:MAG: LysR family transcriptional regulator [Pseudomonadota bacterium]